MNNGLNAAHKVSLVVKNLSASAGDVRDIGSIPGLGRSPGGVHSNPLQSVLIPGESPWTEEPKRLQSIGLQKSWG